MVVNPRLKPLLIVLLMLLGSTGLMANISVRASVDRPQVGLHDQVRYTITVSSDKNISMREPSVPAIPGLIFQTVFTSTSSSISSVNFRTVRQIEKSYTYVFSAIKLGKITFPTFTIAVDNASYTVNAVSIDVLASGTVPQSRQPQRSRLNPFDPFGFDEPSMWDSPPAASGSTFLYAVPEKPKVYLGEPIVVSYYLYTNQAVTSLNLTDEKDYEGYGKEIFEQPNSLEFQTVRYQGAIYKRSLIKRIALSPNNIGKIKAPTLSGMIQMYDFTTRTADIASQELMIDVLPLPLNGRPEPFSGAIGSFNVSGSLDKKETSLGEAFNYTLLISGKGNYNQFTAPLFASSTQFQISEPLVTDNLNAGTEGTRSIYYTIIPQEKGVLDLPTLTFNWFDTNSGTYRSFSSKSEKLTIRPATVFSYFTNFFQRDRQTQINPLIQRQSYRSDTIYIRQGWYWLIVLLIVLALIYSGYMAWDNKLQYRDPARYNDLRAERILKKYLKDAGLAATKKSPEFYPLAEQGLMRYLTQKYRIPMHLPIKDKLELLTSKGIAPELLTMLTTFLDQCQKARYMPGAYDAIRLETDMQSLVTIIKSFGNLKATGEGK